MLFQGVQALASSYAGKVGKVMRFKTQLAARELSIEQLPGSLQEAVQEALAKEAQKDGAAAAVATGGEAKSDAASSQKKKSSSSVNGKKNDSGKAEVKDEKEVKPTESEIAQ